MSEGIAAGVSIANGVSAICVSIAVVVCGVRACSGVLRSLCLDRADTSEGNDRFFASCGAIACADGPAGEELLATLLTRPNCGSDERNSLTGGGDSVR